MSVPSPIDTVSRRPYLPAPGDIRTASFTLLPYLHPAAISCNLRDGEESIAIAWQTNGIKADYDLRYGEVAFNTLAELSEVRIDDGMKHTATLSGLKLGKRYRYRIGMNGAKAFEGYFTTRKPRGAKTRFVALGENSRTDRSIAYQAYQTRPDFVVQIGNGACQHGIYNAEQAGRRFGAPLLRSVPLYGPASCSFDYGDAHFFCLTPDTDLSQTDAAWKFVLGCSQTSLKGADVVLRDRQLLTVVDFNSKWMEMRQVDEMGRLVDRVTMTK